MLSKFHEGWWSLLSNFSWESELLSAIDVPSSSYLVLFVLCYVHKSLSFFSSVNVIKIFEEKDRFRIENIW